MVTRDLVEWFYFDPKERTGLDEDFIIAFKDATPGVKISVNAKIKFGPKGNRPLNDEERALVERHYGTP